LNPPFTLAVADHIGQVLKQHTALAALEHADQQAVQLAQEVALHLHKHGSRPFTLIAPYGRLKLRRQRLLDPRTGKTFIPSAKLWKTKQNRHIVTAPVFCFQSPFSMRSQIESLLLSEVNLPGQYIGGELGSIVKPKHSVKGRLCLAFPDVYTLQRQ